MYTTSLYDHPYALQMAAQNDGLAAASAGVLILALAARWLWLPLRRNRYA
jgi:hypothetical protein